MRHECLTRASYPLLLPHDSYLRLRRRMKLALQKGLDPIALLAAFHTCQLRIPNVAVKATVTRTPTNCQLASRYFWTR
jgi:hypothetical protein